MSRIGKKQIILPDNVSLQIGSNIIAVTGKYGTLERKIIDSISIKLDGNKVLIVSNEESNKAKAYQGLFRSLVNNMVTGVNNLFQKVLIAEGVGYKFQLENDMLVLLIGFSHPIKFVIPEQITVKLESPTKIMLESVDKEQLGLFASKIRAIRPPEPYKGKGIRYQDEKIKRKAGKTRK